MLVKICGLREKQHVDAAVRAGADAVGFVFARSPRQTTPENAAAISAGLPSHVRRVAVMLHPSNEAVQAVLREFSPDVLQTDAEDFEALALPDSVERWPVFREGGIRPEGGGLFVFEGPKSGRGETVDWSAAARIAAGGGMILAGGLAAGNVAEAIGVVRPAGVDVSSAVERAPGHKDPEKIREFIDAARAAEHDL